MVANLTADLRVACSGDPCRRRRCSWRRCRFIMCSRCRWSSLAGSAFLVTGAMGICWLALWSIIGRPPYLVNINGRQLKAAWPDLERLWLVVASFGLGAVALGLVSYLSPLYLQAARSISRKTTWQRTLDSAARLGVGYFLGLDRGQIRYARIGPANHLFVCSRSSRCPPRW